MTDRAPLRVAVVGLGPIGNLHARLYSEDPAAQLVAVCDRDPIRAAAAAAKFAVPAYANCAQMLGSESVHLVSVATGGYEYCSDHYEPTMQSLRRGCAVLCEKPICDDLGRAREMVEAANDNNVAFAIDFNHRFTPAAYTAKRWAREGRLGSLLFCNMALWIGKFGEFDSVNYHLKALSPHSVDMMQWFCGPISEVQCFAMTAPDRNIRSTASINVRFECGAVGHLTSSYDIARAHSVERCEVAGTKGRLVVEDMWREATLFPADSEERTVFANPVFGGFRDFEDTFRERLRQFVCQVARGDAPADIDGSGADGLSAQRVIHAAIRSIDEGSRAVAVAEI